MVNYYKYNFPNLMKMNALNLMKTLKKLRNMVQNQNLQVKATYFLIQIMFNFNIKIIAL